MAGFIRRFGTFPGVEKIREIEGVVIVDLAPPGSVEGVGSGTVAIVGEFADMRHAVEADTSAGTLSTKVEPVELFSSQVMLNEVGGWDETLGEFGGDGGSGFLAIKNKRFSRLVGVPVNLASAQGSRYVRQLPVCKSQSDADPSVRIESATVAAGREFNAGSGSRLRIAQRVTFTGRAPITTGTGGSTTSGASAATQTFDAGGGFDWTTIDRPDGTKGAKKGDILVIGNDDGSGGLQPSAEAGTYRVASTPSAGSTISVEQLDGTNFSFSSQSNVPWRLHFSTDADTAPEKTSPPTPGGSAAGDNSGYIIPIRPLTDSSGATSDGTYSTGTVLTPQTTPPSTTGDTWDPLSGLQGILHPGSATQYTAALQQPNAGQSSDLDAAYTTAIDALLGDGLPQREVNIVTAARQSSTIRNKLRSHVLRSSKEGVGRMTILNPGLDQQSLATILGDSDPGVGANRDERVLYGWPGVRHFVREAVNTSISAADGTVVDDGILDESFHTWIASLLSVLAPERNPGQAAPPVPSAFAPILGLQRGSPSLGLSEYIQLRDKGIMAPRIDRTVGPIIQSGVTTSLVAGQKNVHRRRMADFIQDSLSQRLVQLSKLPLTERLKDELVGETAAFLEELRSPDNPAAQRIESYEIDDESGNTPDLNAKGVFVLIPRVNLIDIADNIVLQTEIGAGVEIRDAA